MTIPLISNSIVTNDFDLNLKVNSDYTKIFMRLKCRATLTSSYPKTSEILRSYLPTIFKSTCFNKQNYSFEKEVKSTEIGHLFEHILLEYLCKLRLLRGHKKAVYNGRTQWNWRKHERGTFLISVDSNFKDIFILQEAINKSVDLIHIILNRDPKTFSSPQTPTNRSVLVKC